MASKTEATPQKEEMLEKGGPQTQPDGPLLDLSDATCSAISLATPGVSVFMRKWVAPIRLPSTRLSLKHGGDHHVGELRDIKFRLAYAREGAAS